MTRIFFKRRSFRKLDDFNTEWFVFLDYVHRFTLISVNIHASFIRTERWRMMYKKLFMNELQLKIQTTLKLNASVTLWLSTAWRKTANINIGIVNAMETKQIMKIFLTERIVFTVTIPALTTPPPLPAPAPPIDWTCALICLCSQDDDKHNTRSHDQGCSRNYDT